MSWHSYLGLGLIKMFDLALFVCFHCSSWTFLCTTSCPKKFYKRGYLYRMPADQISMLASFWLSNVHQMTRRKGNGELMFFTWLDWEYFSVCLSLFKVNVKCWCHTFFCCTAVLAVVFFTQQYFLVSKRWQPDVTCCMTEHTQIIWSPVESQNMLS